MLQLCPFFRNRPFDIVKARVYDKVIADREVEKFSWHIERKYFYKPVDFPFGSTTFVQFPRSMDDSLATHA